MSLLVTSIDSTAAGFVRHRFVRAMAAAWVVLTVAGFTALVIGATVLNEPDEETGPVLAALVAVIVFAIFAVPSIVGAAIAVSAINQIDRRVVALIAIIVFGGATLIMPLAAVGGLLDIMGLLEADAPVAGESPASGDPLYQSVAIIFFSGLSVVVAWELVGWARWQLMTSTEGFMATRGWRPPSWHIFSNLRQALGLPAFVSNVGRGRSGLTLLYFAVSLLNVGVAAVFALPFLAMTDNTESELPVVIGIAVALIVLLALNVFGAGSWMASWADRSATDRYQSVREWDARAPVVFLRTFEQDDAQLPALVTHPLLKLPAGVSSPRTMDEILLEHASPYGPVIAIGDPRDPVPPLGAARVFVPGPGNEWQDVVRSLVESAQLVVMCPSDTEGVKWELDLLARNADVRVAYLANPELAPEVTLQLFRDILPGGTGLSVGDGEAPLAAFYAPGDSQWRVLTTTVQPSVQTYTIALNVALQAILGPRGRPLVRPKRQRRRGGSRRSRTAART